MNDFENELKKQPLRAVPEHWRAQILNTARNAMPGVKPAWSWWDLFWPSPKAWGALAAAWAVLFCFNMVTREQGTSTERPEAAQIRMAVEQRRELQAEIEEASVRLETPKPRSEARHPRLSA